MEIIRHICLFLGGLIATLGACAGGIASMPLFWRLTSEQSKEIEGGSPEMVAWTIFRMVWVFFAGYLCGSAVHFAGRTIYKVSGGDWESP